MMKAYSKDLREKIVDAIAQQGMPKTEAARTFGVGISTVKRYMSKAQRGESLEPGKAPGRAPKIGERERKLLEEDLKERPFARLSERCDYLQALSGIRVSRSTVCRAIERMEQTRKKGDELQQSETSF
jgi:transposase